MVHIWSLLQLVHHISLLAQYHVGGFLSWITAATAQERHGILAAIASLPPGEEPLLQHPRCVWLHRVHPCSPLAGPRRAGPYHHLVQGHGGADKVCTGPQCKPHSHLPAVHPTAHHHAPHTPSTNCFRLQGNHLPNPHLPAAAPGVASATVPRPAGTLTPI